MLSIVIIIIIIIATTKQVRVGARCKGKQGT